MKKKKYLKNKLCVVLIGDDMCWLLQAQALVAKESIMVKLQAYWLVPSQQNIHCVVLLRLEESQTRTDIVAQVSLPNSSLAITLQGGGRLALGWQIRGPMY